MLISAPTARIAGQPAGRRKTAMSGIRMAKRNPTNRSGGTSSSASFIAEKFDPQARITTAHQQQVARWDHRCGRTGARPASVSRYTSRPSIATALSGPP